MNCPSCTSTPLTPRELEPVLQVLSCQTCNGDWVPSAAYWRWLTTKHNGRMPDGAEPGVIADPSNSSHAMLCPACSRILIKFKVGHGVDFRLDRCHACNGIWLDQHAWEALKAQRLHVELHRICTSAWQKQRHASEQWAWFDQTYDRKFGQTDYTEVKKIRQWLDLHPKKSDLLAYLNDPDPYHV